MTTAPLKTRAAPFLSQKAQALFCKVRETDQINEVRSYLRGSHQRAITFYPGEEQLHHINDTYKHIKTLLVNCHTPAQADGLQGYRATCNHGAPAELLNTYGQPEEIINAKLAFIQSFRNVVDPGFDTQNFDILYQPNPSPSSLKMHRHEPNHLRFAILALEKEELTTEYPGLLKNQQSAPGSILFFGGDFWHSANTQEKRPILSAMNITAATLQALRL